MKMVAVVLPPNPKVTEVLVGIGDLLIFAAEMSALGTVVDLIDTLENGLSPLEIAMAIGSKKVKLLNKYVGKGWEKLSQSELKDTIARFVKDESGAAGPPSWSKFDP